MFKRTLLSATAAALLAMGAVHADAATFSNTIVLREAPPPPREEIVPAPRRGYVWAPGYWGWEGHRHHWHAGHWVRERRGYVYSSPAWVQQGDSWHLQQGHWRRGDRDHDGVPNGADRHPNDPYRR